MRIVIIEFMSLDGVVQAPGGADEDTDGGFAHGGWTHSFFDNEVVGGAFAGTLGRRGRAALRAAHVADDGGRLARPGRRPVRRSDERHREVRRLVDAQRQ